MKKSIIAVLLSSFFFMQLSAFEWGGIEKVGANISTTDFNSVSPVINSTTYLWGSAPIADTGFRFVTEGLVKYSGNIGSSSIVNSVIVDLDLLKIVYEGDNLNCSIGRFFASDVTACVLNQNIDGIKVDYSFPYAIVSGYAGYTGLLNELNVFMLDTTAYVISPLNEVYSLAYPFVITGASFLFPVIAGNQNLSLEALAAIDIGAEKVNRYYASAKIGGPLGIHCFYDVNEVVGSLNFNNFMHSTKVDFYFYPTAALAFIVGAEYASKDFVAVTSNPIFGNLAGLEANGNAGAKAGVTYVADTFIVTGDVVALCSMPESGFQFSGFQYDLSVIYNIFYDFQLSFGTYGFIDSAENGKNNNFGMNLNLSLSF